MKNPSNAPRTINFTLFIVFAVLNVVRAFQPFTKSSLNSRKISNQQLSLPLCAKKKRAGKKTAYKQKITNKDEDATNLPVATIAGVSEDHRYEQFFYDEKSTARLYKIVKEFSKPLLLCNPSLAILAESDVKQNHNEDFTYLLLDRDIRFKFLSHYKEFSLMEPFLITSYSYDAIFIDPPFANITPIQLVNCIKRMAPDIEKSSVPVYIAYNSMREKQLLSAFNEYPGPKLERKWRLSYRTVSEDTQDKIWLYGPVGDSPF